MMLGILGGIAAYWLLKRRTERSHKYCPAGIRKHSRKCQSRARRVLRSPEYRGDRAMHRAARRLIALTRKSHNRTTPWRPLSIEDAKLLGECMKGIPL